MFSDVNGLSLLLRKTNLEAFLLVSFGALDQLTNLQYAFTASAARVRPRCRMLGNNKAAINKRRETVSLRYVHMNRSHADLSTFLLVDYRNLIDNQGTHATHRNTSWRGK